MRKLRTLNIRNVPPFDPAMAVLPLEESYAAFANNVLKLILNVPPQSRGRPCKSTCTIGS